MPSGGRRVPPITLWFAGSLQEGSGEKSMVNNVAWRKSSYSGGSGGNCVEAANAASVVMVRDTRDRDGQTLAFTTETWEAFTASLRH
jgi:hypothetical protein